MDNNTSGNETPAMPEVAPVAEAVPVEAGAAAPEVAAPEAMAAVPEAAQEQTLEAAPATEMADAAMEATEPAAEGTEAEAPTGTVVEQAQTVINPEAAAAAAQASAPTMNPAKVKIEVLLEQCIRRGASDLHIQSGMQPILRVDGALMPIPDTPILSTTMVDNLIFSTLDSIQRETLMKDKEFDYSFSFGELARFRVNAFSERGNLAAAFRLIPTKMPTIDDLGMPPVVSTFADYPRGLVLVTGPTGSGKSTTLAALINKINQEKPVHIITIEDPIEFTHKSQRAMIAQREVHYDTFSFARALKSVLREDPDVVLVGEMRDLETISAAITLAETGHLVFGTLHTNSAAQSVDRMIDVFPAQQQPQIRSQLASVIMAICSQRLIPAVSGGRVVAAEIMVANSAVRSIIREGKTHQLDTTIQTGAGEGMQTMDRTLVKMVQSGVVSYESAREFAVDLGEFDRLARG